MRHAVYDTRYHLVWAPRYRKWILDGEVRDTAKELFNEILAARDCEVIEREIAGDHVHIFASIPPRYSVGETVRVLKTDKCEGNFLVIKGLEFQTPLFPKPIETFYMVSAIFPTLIPN